MGALIVGPAAVVHAILCVAVVGFHLAVIMGAPVGRVTQGGQHTGALPVANRVVAGLSAALTGVVALAVLSAAGHWPGWPHWTGWGAVGFGAVALVANLATPSVAERRLWAPVAAMMLISAVVVMLA